MNSRRSTEQGRTCAVEVCAVDTLEERRLLSAVTVQVGASLDNTIYQGAADVSNGQGEFVLAGSNSRGLVQFDVGSASIPDGSTIIDAVLTLNVGYSVGGTSSVSIHRVNSAWGASTSNAVGDETQGAAARQFDATWFYSFYDGETWDSVGGDFGSVSASENVGGVGAYEWIGGPLIDDVQAWVDNAVPNFGWLVQASGDVVKAFISMDSPDSSLAPTLEITYEAPPAPNGIVEGRIWNDVDVDGKPADNPVSNLGLTIFRSTFFNAFGGQEYWYRSGSANSWYYLTPDANLTKWSGTAGELSGEVVTTLDPRFYYDPSLIVQGVETSEAWLNDRTIELLDSQGSVFAATQTVSRDINQDGQIDPVSEAGWYRFNDVPSDETFTVRQVLPNDWSESARIEFDLQSGMEQLINGLNLQMRGSYFEGVGGLGEKWIYSSVKGWHYVTPDGGLYRWNAAPIGGQSLSGVLVASLGNAYFQDPSGLFDGQYREAQFQDGELLSRVDFGTFESQTVAGRVWLDFYANGVREEMTHLPEVFPDHDLAAGEAWFYDEPNDDWYIVNTDGQVEYWGKSPPNTGSSKLSEGGGTQSAIYQVEPWLNLRTVELLDMQGTVVATTVSRSIDLNNDGVIEYESERGLYRFEGIAPGDYTVRTVTDQDWTQTSPVSTVQAKAIALSARFGFRTTSNDFMNWGGKDERWLIDSVGRWYYILTDGSLYEWESGTGVGTELRGTLLATLSTDYYDDLKLLVNPDASTSTVRVSSGKVSRDLIFGNHRFLDGLLSGE